MAELLAYGLTIVVMAIVLFRWARAYELLDKVLSKILGFEKASKLKKLNSWYSTGFDAIWMLLMIYFAVSTVQWTIKIGNCLFN